MTFTISWPPQTSEERTTSPLAWDRVTSEKGMMQHHPLDHCIKVGALPLAGWVSSDQRHVGLSRWAQHSLWKRGSAEFEKRCSATDGRPDAAEAETQSASDRIRSSP